MIGLQSQHTQGAGPMKGNAGTSRRPTFRTVWRTGLIAAAGAAGAGLRGADAAALEPDASTATPPPSHCPRRRRHRRPSPPTARRSRRPMPLAQRLRRPPVRGDGAGARRRPARARPGDGDRAERPRAQRARLRHHRRAARRAGRRAHRVPPGVAVEVLRRHHDRHAGVRRRAALGQQAHRLHAGASSSADPMARAAADRGRRAQPPRRPDPQHLRPRPRSATPTTTRWCRSSPTRR